MRSVALLNSLRSFHPRYSDPSMKFSSRTVFTIHSELFKTEWRSIFPYGSQQRFISKIKTVVLKGKRTQELDSKSKKTKTIHEPIVVFTQPPQFSSATLQSYQRLFPDITNPHEITDKLHYQQAKELYPERFDLSTIGKIFESWKACLRPNHPCLTSTDLKSIISFYEKREFQPYVYDKVTYLSTVWTSNFAEYSSHPPTFQLDIKLSNNRFLCPESKELKVHKEKITRHDESTTWCQLDHSEVRKWFSSMIQFTERFLGKEAQNKVWFNFHTNQIDFKSILNTGNPLLAICIILEPGGPFIDFEDIWQNE
eukprot:TRINITY_DN4989_c0_g1_i1.p1 TRINITY_DN4989_c0_g1~~TRINITY_DN4989_c0_g1_i1.p1  ORF type:complete len:311 (+),score=42.16 TRINITY_DN4989_c0_g1_i1:105-1037(+)